MLNKTVYQIAIGSTPEKIKSYMDSVKLWCDNNNYQYTTLTKMSDWCIKNKLSPVVASEWMRIELLIKNPYSCFVDWGIEIKDNIILNESPLLFPFFDQFIYNGNNTELFKIIYKKMIEKKSKSRNEWKDEIGIIYKAFRNTDFDRFWFKDSNGLYVHNQTKNVKELGK
jgi:hypothetical protein